MATTSENWEKRYRETNKNQNRHDPVFNPSVKKVKNGYLLSAAILLRRYVDDSNLTVRLQGKIFRNPGAKFPINEKTFADFDNILFQ